eukprot:1793537-Rhodomonas_salina.1
MVVLTSSTRYHLSVLTFRTAGSAVSTDIQYSGTSCPYWRLVRWYNLLVLTSSAVLPAVAD